MSTSASGRKRATLPKTLVIDRDRWARGEDPDGKACLLNEKGLMCCLGFMARKIGFTPAQIRGRSMPGDVLLMHPKKGELFGPLLRGTNDRTFTPDAIEAAQLAGVNDRGGITEEEREELITKKFGKLGVKVRFIGKKGPAKR